MNEINVDVDLSASSRCHDMTVKASVIQQTPSYLFKRLSGLTTVKYLHHWSFVLETTCNLWIPHTKGQLCGKYVHVISPVMLKVSSCHDVILIQALQQI